jgi:hypothetical protein
MEHRATASGASNLNTHPGLSVATVSIHRVQPINCQYQFAFLKLMELPRIELGIESCHDPVIPFYYSPVALFLQRLFIRCHA